MVSRVRFALAFLLLAAAAAPARADLISFFGDERVGTSGGQFLRVPAGARGIAMGGGMSATADAASAPFWNPAAMTSLGQQGRLFVSHMQYVADIDINHISYVQRMGAWQLGLMGGMLSSGEILRTTEFYPNGQGETFRADQYVVGVSMGRALTDRFNFATTVKFLQENLDEFENRGVFLDLGATYFIGYNRSRIGFSVRNFGGDMRLNDEAPDAQGATNEWQSFPSPTVALFGFAYDFGQPESRMLTLSLDFSHPSDEVESLILGSELKLNRRVFLRGGYRNQVEEGGLSAGFGLDLTGSSIASRLDYAYDDHGSFGGIHVFSLEIGR